VAEYQERHVNSHKQIIKQIEELFVTRLFVHVDSPEIDLFEAGVLDSLGLVEILFGIEQEFGIPINLAELDLDQFRSIGGMARFISDAAPKAAEDELYEDTRNQRA
jgi:D-alanine--poly(phosphoribitol) ligase subunit 2